jgi:hypothetical protein
MESFYSLKHQQIPMIAPLSSISISVKFFSSVIGNFLSLLLCYWSIFHSRLPEQFSESQAASCKHSQGPIADVEFLKRVTESIFKTSKKFHKLFTAASRNFDFDFSIKNL